MGKGMEGDNRSERDKWKNLTERDEEMKEVIPPNRLNLCMH
jgi:hypothetical protein